MTANECGLALNIDLDTKITFLCVWEVILWCIHELVAAILDLCKFSTFPVAGLFGTFSMLIWGPHRNALWQKKFFCNFFQVKTYLPWAIWEGKLYVGWGK